MLVVRPITGVQLLVLKFYIARFLRADNSWRFQKRKVSPLFFFFPSTPAISVIIFIIFVLPLDCGEYGFLCEDRTCIHLTQKCDGISQCPESLDEVDCYTGDIGK